MGSVKLKFWPSD